MRRYQSDLRRIAPTNRAADQVVEHLTGLTPLSDHPGKDLPPMLPWAGSAFALASLTFCAIPTRSGGDL